MNKIIFTIALLFASAAQSQETASVYAIPNENEVKICSFANDSTRAAMQRVESLETCKLIRELRVCKLMRDTGKPHDIVLTCMNVLTFRSAGTIRNEAMTEIALRVATEKK